MGYEKEGEQMGEFVEGIVFGVKSFKDIRSMWKDFKNTEVWVLDKKQTLDMIDNFIDIYQGAKELPDLLELRDEIEKE